jgi:hypothetical protein
MLVLVACLFMVGCQTVSEVRVSYDSKKTGGKITAAARFTPQTVED